MIKSGLTTNERIKKSGLLSMFSEELKKLEKEKKSEEDETKKKEREDKIETIKRDFVTLKNMKSEGFIKNMKEIIYA